MTWGQFMALAQDQWQHTTRLELVAVIFSIAQVLLALKNSVLTYPAGIVSTAIFTWLMAQPDPGLYADAALNFYYLVMSIYGWIAWHQKRSSGEALTVTHANLSDWIITLAISLTAFGILYFVLLNFTPSTVPLWDSVVSALAWSGMWLLARRKVENWLVLNLSNAVAIPLLFHKHFAMTALLTIFLFTVAVFGYFRWRRIARTGNA